MNPSFTNTVTDLFTLNKSIGVTVVGAVVVLLIQYCIILVWLFSPFAGSIKLEDIKRKPFAVFSSLFMLIGLDLLLIGLSSFLHLQIEGISNTTLTLLIMIYVPIAALIVANYFAWVLAQAESSLPDELKSFKKFGASSDLSFQEKRRERLEKRAKKR